MKRRDFINIAGSSIVLGTANVLASDVGSDNSANSALSGIEQITESSRTIPVAHRADVVVCGGGPAGFSAAVAAARRGARTLLLESASALGGIWTAGAVCLLLDHQNKDGQMKEILQRLKSLGGLPNHSVNSGTCYDVETMKYVLDLIAAEAGVSVQLYTRVSAVLKDQDNRVTAVITESKSGREAVLGKVFIDCTGDGDVAVQAGCGFDFGRPADGSFMPMSLMALLTGLDEKEAICFVHRPQELLAEFNRLGIAPSYRRPSLWKLNEKVYGLMTTHVHNCKGTDVRDLTRATISARAELNEIVTKLRSAGGMWRNLRLVSTAEKIGVREGRRIHGLYTITEQDLRQGRRHEDAVCRVTYCVDVHSPQPPRQGKPSIEDSWQVQPYDIPMRAMIAKDVKGLLMAGRCISGDFIAHSSYRVTGNAVAMGEAAGKYAADLCKKNI